MNEPRQSFIEVPYIEEPKTLHRIAAYEWGDAQNPRVLFCAHGLTRNARDFDFLAAALAHRYRVIALDMPGRGKSEWLRDGKEYTLPCYVLNMDAVWQALKLGQVDWLGTSMGGWIGMMAAATKPERIGKLVLNDIGAFVPRASLMRLAGYVGKQVRFPDRLAAEAAYRVIYEPFGLDADQQWQHLLRYSFEEAPEGGLRSAYDPAIGAGLADPEKLQDVDLWKLWEQVNCPALLLRGEKSDILSAETAARMQELHPALTVVEIPGVGHAPSLLKEQEIAIVRDWLS